MIAIAAARLKNRDGPSIMKNPPPKNSSGPAELKLICPAKINALHDALDAIEQACNAWKVDSSLVSRVRIVVEELFSNTIKYGYGAECDKPVRLCLRPHPGLTLVYEDEAPPFNPLAWKAKLDEELPVEERPIGLAGIAIVMGLSTKASFQRRDGANCLTITFAEKR
jgi:serine/threonine-protein kinase RsbW